MWADITSFVPVVAGGQWLHLQVMLSKQITVPPAVVSVLGLLALLVLHAICDAARDETLDDDGCAVISIQYRNRAGASADATSAVRAEADLAEQQRKQLKPGARADRAANAPPIPGLLG